MNRVENITDYKSSPTQANYMLNGGILELPYKIRPFRCVIKRMGCRDPVLFVFFRWFYTRRQMR